MTTLDIEFIETDHVPTVEPVVFERNGRVYANTRDLAAYYGRDHKRMVQKVELAIKRSPEEVGNGDVVEVFYRDDRRRPAMSYDLSRNFFQKFGCYVAYASLAKAHRYHIAYYNKEKEVRVATSALPRTVEEMEQALRKGIDLDDSKMLRAMALIYLNKVLELKKCNDALTQDNGRLTLEKAELAGQLQELQSALGEAVSPSLFRN